MVRVFSTLLQISLAATAVNAQFGDFIKNAFGSAIAKNPLVRPGPDAFVAGNTANFTSDNWRSHVNVTLDETAGEEDTQQWLLYFTTNATTAGTRNVTYWDAVYTDTVYALATQRPVKLHFGKADCSAPASKELCYSFYLTSPRKLPVFYHIATYLKNGTTEIRQATIDRNATEPSGQAEFLTKFYGEQQWKEVSPWTGFFNPIDGVTKDYSHILGPALQYYEMLPQWALMVFISLIGRYLATRVAGSRPQPPQRVQTN